MREPDLKATISDDISNDGYNKIQALQKWKSFITSFLMQSIILGIIESFGALLPAIQKEYFKDGGEFLSAMIGSLTQGLQMGFSPISSSLLEKIGPQILALCGGVITFTAALMTSFSTSFIPMALFYGVCFGIGASMVLISTNVTVSHYFGDDSNYAYGLLGLGNGIMNSLMPHIISYSAYRIKVAGTFRLISLLVSSIIFYPLYWSKKSDTMIMRDSLTESEIRNPSFKSHKSFRQSRRSSKYKAKPEFESSHPGSSVFFPTGKRLFHTYGGASNPKSESNLTTAPGELSSENMKSATINVTPSQTNIPEDNLIQIRPISKIVTSYDDKEEYSPENKKMSFTKSSSFTGDKRFTWLRLPLCLRSPIFKNKMFLVLVVSMVIAMFGYQVPNVHIINYSRLTYPKRNADLLLTCIGASSAIGPVITGFIMDVIKPYISRYRVYQILILSYGMVTLTLIAASTYESLIIICVIIGFIDGSFSSMLNPLTIDLVGQRNVGRAIGVYNGCVALPVTMAPPMAGIIYEKSHNYKISFFVAGCFFILGGILLNITLSDISKKQELSFEKSLTSGESISPIYGNDEEQKRYTPSM